MQTEPTEDVARQVVADLYGRTPEAVRRCHSGCNASFVVTLGGGLADRVVKLSRHNSWAIEIERHLYPAMREADLPVPEVEFSQLDYHRESSPFIVMPKFSDHTLEALVGMGDDITSVAFEHVGHFLAILHEAFVDGFSTISRSDELRVVLSLQQAAID